MRERDRIIGGSKDTTRITFFERDPEFMGRTEVALRLVGRAGPSD